MQKFRKIIYNILQNNNLYILKTLNYSLERKTVCSALGLLRYLAWRPHIRLRLGNESLTAFMTGHTAASRRPQVSCLLRYGPVKC